tara:strand:- start:58 stop:414 length:357 start_codon:yes stop_codon:yes gene_type:complete
MSVEHEDIRHDGGTHRVEVEIEGEQCVIRFGTSFTLRVDETNLNTLREMIHDAARDMAIERRDTTDLLGKKFVVAEDDFIQRGIDARQQIKVEQMMKGTVTPAIDPFDPYNPNDPRNW